MNNNRLYALINFHNSRSAELNQKGTLSYMLWASFFLISMTLYLLHFRSTVNGFSIYYTVFPLLAIVWASCIIYVNYKSRLLWTYLVQTEKVIDRLLLKEDDDKEKMPYWAGTVVEKVKLIEVMKNKNIRQITEPLIGTAVSIVYGYTVVKGVTYLFSYAELRYPELSAYIYATSCSLAFLILCTVYINLHRRVLRAESEQVFIVETKS